MKLRACLSFIIISLLLLANTARAAVSQLERDALLDLYTATGGAAWHNNTGWNGTAGTECSWYGVTCDGGETTVIGLDLSANNLKGPLSATLANLSGLTVSDFRYNGVYSDDSNLINFLDASGPVGSLHDTQTLDADGIVFSNVTDTGFDLSWNAVNYEQVGGYRIYMAEQVDGETGSVMTNFVEIADLNDKLVTSHSVSGLTGCRQYFFKVLSYTSVHLDSPNEMMSDGVQGPVVGTIPGFSEICNLVGSPYDDIFNLSSGGDLVADYSVTIQVDSVGNRVYDIVYPGNSIIVGSINGVEGTDSLNVNALGSVDISLGISLSGTLSVNSIENISANPDSTNTLIGSNTSNTWNILGDNAGDVNGAVTFSGIQNLSGGTGVDTFIINGTISGIINGGLGVDSFNILTGTTSGINTGSLCDTTNLSNDITISSNISTSEVVSPTEPTSVDLSCFQINNLDPILYPVYPISFTPVTDFVYEGTETVTFLIFKQSDFTGFEIPENAEPTAVAARLVDHDLLNEIGIDLNITFEILSGNEEGQFEVQNDGGLIKLIGSLDYETVKSYKMELQVYINEHDAGVHTITINVTDVAENGGCTLRPGTPFDPIWLFMLLMASVYYLRRGRSLS